MKIKNLNITKTGVVLLTTASIAFLSSGCVDKTTSNEEAWQTFLDTYGIIPIEDIENFPKIIYRVKVSEPVYNDGPFHFNEHWEPIDSIDHFMGIAREYDADYQVLKINFENGKYFIYKKTVEDINDRPKEYDYVFEDNYLVTDDSSYEDVYIIKGKVKKRE